jgi:hypothetical protein
MSIFLMIVLYFVIGIIVMSLMLLFDNEDPFDITDNDHWGFLIFVVCLWEVVVLFVLVYGIFLIFKPLVVKWIEFLNGVEIKIGRK